jgi:hypothetical protein
MKARWALVAAVMIGASLISAVAYTTQYVSPYPSPSCATLQVTRHSLPSGLSTYLCGTKGVSDGKLSMTLNNYRFVDGRTLNWVCYGSANGTSCSSSGVYLLANATFTNVGQGNTSIGPDLFVNVTNAYTGTDLSNGELGANVTFPGQYPNSSLPASPGGAFLPPGKTITYWFIFVLPSANLKDIPDLRLNFVSFAESVYGGVWEGGGQFRCPCGNPEVDLIIATSPSTPNTTLGS